MTFLHSFLLQMDLGQKNSSIPPDLSAANATMIDDDDANDKHLQASAPSRSSIKSFLTKKFQPLGAAGSMDVTTTTTTNDTKPKKPRTSFRQFSHFLKRSHSAHGDLASVRTAGLPLKPSEDPNAPLKSIREEEIFVTAPPRSSSAEDSLPASSASLSK